MSDETGSIEKEGKKLSSLLEKVVDWKFLILMLSFFLYVDIWLLRVGVDPTTLALDSGYEALKKIPLFSAVIFILSYSLLMAGFFPALRKIVGLAQLYIRSSVSISNQSLESKRLSDWSFAFVALSAYDAITGYFGVKAGYKGLAVFVLDFLQSEGFEVVIFRLCVVFLWLACFSYATEVDDPVLTNA